MRVPADLAAKLAALAGQAPAQPRGNKYHARKVTVGGLTFDSLKEARRWAELLLLERAGVIARLERQTSFPLIVKRQEVCRYVADFVYYENGALVVEDVKSEFTRRLPLYRLKAKLMRACHGITIREA